MSPACKYLKGHPKLGLWYPKESPFDLVAYSDSDYGGATQDRKSTTGGYQFLGRRLCMTSEALSRDISSSILRLLHTAKTLDLVWIWLGGDYGNVFLMGFNGIQCNTIMARLQFCDYHNVVAILEKSKHNVGFHPMVDFIEASPLRINLKLKDEEGISFLPDTELFENLTLMGYNISPNQKFTFQKGFNEFSSNIATALVCLATNRTYNFSKMIFDGLVKNVNNKGEGSGIPTETHHTSSPEAQPPSHTTNSSSSLLPVTTTIPTVIPSETTPIRQYTRRARIAQSFALPTIADEPESPLRDISQGEACPTDSGFIADQDRTTIAKSSSLPYDSAPRVTSPAATEGSMQQTINELTALLKARLKLLEDRQGVAAEGSEEDAPIKGRSLDEGEAAAERTSDDTEEMATVLTSMDAATVLASGAAEVPTGSGSIPTSGSFTVEVPTSSDVVPTASPVFATATVVTPYRRRKGKEVMVESETPKKQKVQEQIDSQVARELEEQLERERIIEDRNNETVAKYLQEYHQFSLELPIERRIELISDLVKYQDNYAKIYKFQSQQSKPWTKKQKRDYYIAVIRSNLGWKVKDFRDITFEEVKAKFNSVWKQLEDFIPMGLKEEAEKIKRKGLSLEQESAKKQKTLEELVPIEEVYVEALQVKHPIINWKVYTKGQRSYWKITRLGGSSASYQFFIDLLKHLDREDLNQLWRLVKETLSNKPPTSDKEIEIWVELSRLYEPDHEDQLWTHT
nr:uncharacterized mitochondrial protein AtMg00810-like [Tanacetum cinerariifolium]